MKLLFDESVNSTNDSRLRLIDNIMHFLEEYPAKVNLDKYELYLILDEVITNGMEHGNRWDKEKRIKVRIFQEIEGNLTISVKDDGIGFNPSIIPKNLNFNGKLTTRGRGIYIIRKFCQAEWNVIGNEIKLKLMLRN